MKSSATFIARWKCKACDCHGEVTWVAGTASGVLLDRIRDAHQHRSPACENSTMVLDAPSRGASCDLYVKFKSAKQVLVETAA